MASAHQLLIDGQWVDAVDGDVADVVSPVSGEVVSVVAAGGPADVDIAVRAAHRAFEKHRFRSGFERAAELDRVAAIVDRRADEITRKLVWENGKTWADANWEVTGAADAFRMCAAEARRLTGETFPAQDPHKKVMTFPQPLGVWAAITPFNFPFDISREYVGAALATGNAVVLKPAPTTAGVVALLAECIAEAGVPDGLFNLLTGSVEMAEALVSHPGVVGIGFTGSPQVGEAITRNAPGKHLLLELGGNGPVIVLDDADPARVAAAIGDAAFVCSGQICVAAERILASDGIHDDIVERVAHIANGLQLGDPFSEATNLGPVNNEGVAGKMDDHIGDAVKRGARLAAGGRRADGFPTALYYQPTVLADVPADAEVSVHETFGPIAPFTRMGSDEEILAAANASEFGLSSAVFTQDLDRAFWFAERLQSGQVIINDTSTYGEAHLPFGGYAGKRSGTGRIGVSHITESFVQIKTVSIDVRKR